MVADAKDEMVSTEKQGQPLETRPATEDSNDRTVYSTTENDRFEFHGDQKRPVDADEAEKQGNETASLGDDENIIFWDGEDDPANPYNWSSWLKVLNCVLVSALTFLTPLGSCTLPMAVT